MASQELSDAGDFRSDHLTAPGVYRRLLIGLASHPGPFGLSLLAVFGASAGTVAVPWLVRSTLQRYTETPEFGVTATGLAAIGIVGVLVVGLQYVARYGMAWVGQTLLVDLRQKLFDKFLELSAGHLARAGSGSVIGRMLNDVAVLDGFALHGVLIPVGRVTTAIGILFTMVYLSWKLTLVVLVLGPVLGAILRYTALRIRRRVDAAQQSKAQMTGLLYEQFRGLLEILSYGAQEQERERFGGINRQSATHALAATRHHATSEAVIGFALIVTLAAVIGFGAYQVTGGSLTRTDLFTFGLLFVAIYDPIRRLSTTSYEIQRSVASARRIYAVLDTPIERRGGRPIAVPVLGSLRFEQVEFRYDDEHDPVLSNVDVRIEARDSVALVGASGVGKTSFLYLLLDFYPPSRGRVLIDDQNVAELDRESVRRQIGWVSQDPFLFQGTILDNIRFGTFDADDAQIRRAARLADVESFVSELPDGYRTRLTETGSNLSQGQRVRIALARAILRDPAILIMDEPTSALDSATESRIYAEIAEWLEQRTTIVISHRLSTVLACRSAIVLEGGRVAGQGPTRLLLAECEPFRRIFHKQIAEGSDLPRLDGAGAR